MATQVVAGTSAAAAMSSMLYRYTRDWTFVNKSAVDFLGSENVVARERSSPKNFPTCDGKRHPMNGWIRSANVPKISLGTLKNCLCKVAMSSFSVLRRRFAQTAASCAFLISDGMLRSALIATFSNSCEGKTLR